MIKNVSVIGAGTMGNGIAHVFAQAGFSVTLIDVNAAQLEKAIATIGKNFDRQVAKGTIAEEVKTKALANITTASDVAAGVKNADLVVEAATENVDLKLKIFKSMDENNVPSSICITGMHPFIIFLNQFILEDDFPQ